jgi:hypothetical protein
MRLPTHAISPSAFMRSKPPIRLKEDPQKAWDALHQAWHPNATWAAYIRSMLTAYRVPFEPL